MSITDKNSTDWLDREILEYSKKGIYPFHMPGAKRINPGLSDPFCYDITEIEGFDDLRNAAGILAGLQEKWADIYGAGRAYLSVNGSTCSNLAVIFAATERGGNIFISRDAHPSVWNAAQLNGLSAAGIPAECSPEGFLEPAAPEAIDKMLSEDLSPQAIVVTSPTYEGITADIRSISETAHKTGSILIVDSAHGAHFGRKLLKDFPNPLEEGADAAVVSLHKTLPVLGQLSLILLPEGGEDRIDPSEVKKYLNMFQTSSPSYLLMSSASAGCRYLLEKGEALFTEYTKNLNRFYSDTADLHNVRIIDRDDKDRSKILISTINAGISGAELMSRLREDHSLELEKSGLGYALALSSVMDTKAGFDRLSAALHEIDKVTG